MPSGVRVHGERSGFLQYIDLAALQQQAEDHEALLHVRVRPGDFVAPSSVLAVLVGPNAPDAKALQAMAEAFVVGRDRTEEQDPRFGMVILSEIAQRALVACGERSGHRGAGGGRADPRVDRWHPRRPDEAPRPDVRYDRVTVVPVDQDALLRDVFEPIARDGAHMLEVGLALQRALALVAANTRAPLERGCAGRGRAGHGPCPAGLAAGAGAR